MMHDDKKETGEEKIAETPVEPVKIKPAIGAEIVLDPAEMAILVTLDTRTGAPVVHNIQNCPLRAYAKMLLNEALNLYNLTSQANTTIAVLERHMIDASKGGGKKKDGIELPFRKD